MDQLNEAKLTKLRGEQEAKARRMGANPDKVSISLIASDDFETSGMSKASYKGNFKALIPSSRNETGGLPAQLNLVLNSRVMLKRNINV